MDNELEKKVELNNEAESQENKDEVINGDTHAPTSEEVEEIKENEIPEEVEKTLTQSEVNALVGEARAKGREKGLAEGREEAMRELMAKYGVGSQEELDGIFGKGQSYDMLNDDYTQQGNEFSAIREENALLKSEVIPEKWEDAKLILKGKGLEINLENINSEIATHPEWVSKGGQEVQEEMPPKIKVLGEDSEKKRVEPSDDEIIGKYFRV